MEHQEGVCAPKKTPKKGPQRDLKTSFVGQGNAENESERKRALPKPVGNDFERPGPQ